MKYLTGLDYSTSEKDAYLPPWIKEYIEYINKQICCELSDDKDSAELYIKPLQMIGKLEKFMSTIVLDNRSPITPAKRKASNMVSSIESSSSSKEKSSADPKYSKKPRIQKTSKRSNIVTPLQSTSNNSSIQDQAVNQTHERLEVYLSTQSPAFTAQGRPPLQKKTVDKPRERFPDNHGQAQMMQLSTGDKEDN